MPLAELRRIAASVGERRGWDFSRVRVDRDPVPWDYAEVVRRYLRPTDRVLDVGTGGGERFLALAPYFGTGVGVDADAAMIQTARANLTPGLSGRVSFEVMQAQALRFPESTFDVVLNRHAPVFVDQVTRLLRPGGFFVTQQVAGRDTQSIYSAFGLGSNGEYWRERWRREGFPMQDVESLSEAFGKAGCVVVARGEYDVPFYFQDVESLVFWLKAIPLPPDFAVEKHWRQVDRLIAEHSTPRGIQSNEHRTLLVVRKG